MAQAFGLPGEDELEFQRVERRRQLANMLAGDAMSPIQNMGTGPYASPISPFQGLQKMLAGYLAGRGMNKADEAQKALVLGRQQKLGSAIDYLDQLRKPGMGEVSQPAPQSAPQPGSMSVAPPEGGEVKPFAPPQPEVSMLQDPRLPPVTDPNDPNRLADLGGGNYQLRPVAPALPDTIAAPEVGVTGKQPEVETPESYMAKVRIAAQKAGTTPGAVLEYFPEVKATYDQLVANAKDQRDYRRQEDLARLNSGLRVDEEKTKRQLTAADIVGTQIDPATGNILGRTRDGKMQVIGKVGPNPNDLMVPGADGTPTVNKPLLDAKKQIAKEGASRITVDASQKVETEYGKNFGKGISEQDLATFEAAKKAPEAAERSVRVMQLLRQKPITGAGADFILGMAKVLKQAGFNLGDNEIATTETLISEMGATTLDAIKGSGLGAGQGFTNKDLQFLQEVKGGRINMDATSLDRLARLNYKAQQYTAQKWNDRVKRIPRSAIEGTGLDDSPVTVPPLDMKSGAPLTPAERRELQELERKYGGKK